MTIKMGKYAFVSLDGSDCSLYMEQAVNLIFDFKQSYQLTYLRWNQSFSIEPLDTTSVQSWNSSDC